MKHVTKKSMLCLLLAGLLLTSGCMSTDPAGQSEPTPETEATTEVTATPTPVPTPTPLPTVTPRPVAAAIETPQPGATAQLIDPMDRPTREPLTFNFTQYVSQDLGISFDIPSNWTASTVEGDNTTLVFTEPESDAQEGFCSSVTISVNSFSGAQKVSDAENLLDQIISKLRETYASLECSSKADNTMLGEKGRYVTYWVYVDTGKEEPLKTRGRILVVPKDRKLYQIRYLCPAEFNSDYETVFKKIRSTITEL